MGRVWADRPAVGPVVAVCNYQLRCARMGAGPVGPCAPQGPIRCGMLPPSCIPQDLLFAVARIGAESAVGRWLSRPIVVLRNYQLHSATIARADRTASSPTEDVEEKVRWLTLGGLQIVAADETVGLLAGRLHARHYHRTRRPLSLADCIALAIALSLGQRLATSDPALLGATADEGCPYRVFLDARGRRASVAAIPDEGSTSP